MRRSGRRSAEGLGLSFLDVVFSGFGAIVLLFVIVRGSEPRLIEAVSEDLSAEIAILQDERLSLEREVLARRAVLDEREAELARARAAVARLEDELTSIEGRYLAAEDTATVQNVLEGRLEQARQTLTEEMKRLRARQRRTDLDQQLVGGIPVDSEYIIFIIDTSGSMQSRAWPLLRRKVAETLKLYPRVKGIQVMNDMGQFMFSQYKGNWIPDSPARRKAIVDRLSEWKPFSNSSPVEGIEQAIRRFYDPDKRISLYVLGDEFSGSSIDRVVAEVDSLNRANRAGERRVRIHAVGFPVMFGPGVPTDVTGVRFAVLMRELANRNGGTFVGLNATR